MRNEAGLPQGLGTPRRLGAPTGAQGSHGVWGTPRCLGAPTGAPCCGNQEVDRPCSRGAWTLHAWLGAPALGSSSVCLGRFPASCPLHLPMEPDAALGKIPSGVCCLGPPSRHPRWRRCVRIHGKSLHKYLEKSKREKERRTNCLGCLWGHLGDGHGQMRKAGHQHLSPCRRPQWEPPGPGPVWAVGTEGPWLWGEARPAWVTSRSRGAHVVPSCHFSMMCNRVSELSCLGTSLQVEHSLKWLQGRPWEESGEAPGAKTLKVELALEQRGCSMAEPTRRRTPPPGRLSRGDRVGSVLLRPGVPSDRGPSQVWRPPWPHPWAAQFQPHWPAHPWKQKLLLRSSCPWALHMPSCCPLAASLTRCRGLAPFVSDHRGRILHTGGKDGPRGQPPGWAGSLEDKTLGERS